MERISKIITLFVFIFFCPLSSVPSTLSYAEVPHLINYQGRLTDSGGKPLDGAYKLNFKLYNSAGTLLWQGTHNSVLVQKGVFSVLLGDANDAPYNFSQLAFDEPYFLEIKVCKIEGANETCEVLSPRQQITSAGYAIRAGEAEKLGGKQPTDYTLSTDITSAPTANKAVRMDSNAKLPTSALKTYDSGWFSVATGTSYTKNHNLGTTKVIYQLWFSPNSNGSPCYSIYGIVELDQDGRGNFRGGFVTDLSSTSITISTSAISGNGNAVWDGLGSPAQSIGYTSGYYRILMLALE